MVVGRRRGSGQASNTTQLSMISQSLFFGLFPLWMSVCKQSASVAQETISKLVLFMLFFFGQI